MTKYFDYQVKEFTPLTDSIMQLTVTPMTVEILQYEAGQYVLIDDGAGDTRPFSIANAPLGSSQLEFHIRHSNDNAFTKHLFDHIKYCQAISLSEAAGHCLYHPQPQANDTAAKNPLLFVAGGTGFAPMKALIEDALAHDEQRPMHLFWGARTPSDLYMDALPLNWAKHIQHFNFTPVLSSADAHYNGQAEIGSLQDAVLKYYPSLKEHELYLAGSSDMAMAVINALMSAGLTKENIFCDTIS